MIGDTFLEMRGISKRFGDHEVLRGIDLEVRSGEVCCILGKNGAGKSTLMKILMGVYRRDSGEILLSGLPADIDSPAVAESLGIRMIYQEPELIPELTVAENIFLNNQPLRRYTRLIDYGRMFSSADKALKDIRIRLNPRALVRDLKFSERQLVSVAKACARGGARLIIMDEPTVSLQKDEVDNLFLTMKALAERGLAVIFISHHIDEVLTIADKIVVIRDSEIVDVEAERNDFIVGRLLHKMAGDDLVRRYPKVRVPLGAVFLEARGLSNASGSVADVCFHVRKGEILGLTGLQGAGKTDLARLLYGAERRTSGCISIGGVPVDINSPSDAMRNGISLLDENVRDYLFIEQGTEFNITFSNLAKLSRTCFINPERALGESRYYMRQLDIHALSMSSPLSSLSGGDRQKVAISRCLFSGSRFIIMDEPTKYLDIPSKVEMYNIMNRMVKKGLSILFISSDIEELLGMSDRLLILYSGRIAREIDPRTSTSSDVLYTASCGK